MSIHQSTANFAVKNDALSSSQDDLDANVVTSWAHCCDILSHCCDILSHCCDILSHCCDILSHCCDILSQCFDVLSQCCDILSQFCGYTVTIFQMRTEGKNMWFLWLLTKKMLEYSKNLYVFISLIILWYIQQTKHTFVFPPSSLFNKFSGNGDIYILSCVFQFLMEEVGSTRSNDQEVHEQYVFDVTTLFQRRGYVYTFWVWFRKAHC